MAKGKGKGHGDDDSGNCCCCLCLCILLPPLLVVVGFFFFASGNTRVDRINEYNGRAEQWVDEGIATFANQSFAIGDIHMDTVTTHSGSYYPVRDSCSKKGDPSEKCVYTDAYYYHTVTLLTGDRFHVRLTNRDIYIDDDYFDGTIHKYYTASDLSCSKDTSKCPSKCSSKDGHWDSYHHQCVVTYYLNEVCYRVSKDKDKWTLDVPPKWPLSGNGYGCYYSNNYQPALYSKIKTSSIDVSVRYYMDSFISADECTGGCSSSSISSSSCFGMSRSEQHMTGMIIILIGVGLTALEVGIFVFSCLCCRDTIKGTFGKKKNGLLDNESQPVSTATRGIPTAQAAYDPYGRSYSPVNQPSYVPSNQPGYVPANQPGYVPANQPGYMPSNQPSYVPSSQPTNNIPYQTSYASNY